MQYPTASFDFLNNHENVYAKGLALILAEIESPMLVVTTGDDNVREGLASVLTFWIDSIVHGYNDYNDFPNHGLNQINGYSGPDAEDYWLVGLQLSETGYVSAMWEIPEYNTAILNLLSYWREQAENHDNG